MRWPWTKDEGARVASTQPLEPGWQRVRKKTAQPWQARADFFAQHLGAVRFTSGLLADAAARCTLRVEKCVNVRSDSWDSVDDALAAEVLHLYRGHDTPQRELVRLHVFSYQTVGECYQIVEQDGRRMCWSIRSPFAISASGDNVLVSDVQGGTVRERTARVVPFNNARRLWIADETWPALATSPLKGVMEDCERYWSLGRRIRRETESALVMNGIIWTPSEAHTELAREQSDPGSPGKPGTDLERDYYAVAHRVFGDDDSVEGVVPLLWRWAKDFGPPQKIDLGKPLDAEVLAARTEALECIGRGLNYPQRLLVDGGGDMNHWGAWLLDEQFARNSLAPILERVAWGDLTETVLRPGLRALAAQNLWQGDPDSYRVGFDITPVVAHPDQSKLAIELNAAGLLGDGKTLEITGFEPTDAPTTAELGRWIMRQQVLHARAPDVLSQSIPIPVGEAAPAVAAALDVPSEIRETVPVGPFPLETIGWLD